MRKPTQKPAETCGQVVLEQNLPSTPRTRVALRCFWGGAVGGQEGGSAGQITGWPLAKQVDFMKTQRCPIVDGSLGEESKEIPDFSTKRKDGSRRAAERLHTAR